MGTKHKITLTDQTVTKTRRKAEMESMNESSTDPSAVKLNILRVEQSLTSFQVVDADRFASRRILALLLATIVTDPIRIAKKEIKGSPIAKLRHEKVSPILCSKTRFT